MGKEIFTFFNERGEKIDVVDESDATASVRYYASEEFYRTTLYDVTWSKEHYDKMPEGVRSAEPLVTKDPIWVHPTLERQLVRSDGLKVDSWRRHYYLEDPARTYSEYPLGNVPDDLLILDELCIERLVGRQSVTPNPDVAGPETQQG